MTRHELLLAEEVETKTAWCEDCLRESRLEVTYYVTPLGSQPYLDTLVWCESCEPAEIEET